jgi:hypothetical protein
VGIYQYPGRYFDTPKNSNEFDHIMFRQHKKWFNLLSSRIVGLGAITEGDKRKIQNKKTSTG